MHLVGMKVGNGEKEEKESLEEVCEEILVENEENLFKRKEDKMDSRKEKEKIEDRERRIFRARVQQEIFLREYTKKKKENVFVKWTDEKVMEKKMLWRQYREKEEELGMDADEKLEIIAKLMQRIPERKPKQE